MFTKNDLEQIRDRGSELRTVERQIENFKKGFPFIKLEKAATPADGIVVMKPEEISRLVAYYEKQSAGKSIVKFVPASGAASRMFKLLFEFLEIDGDKQAVEKAMNKASDLQSIQAFFKRIEDFAFFTTLDKQLSASGKSIKKCLESHDYASILRALLDNEAMGYGNAPKGLLEFHKYPKGTRTPVMEHLAEGALYAQSAGGKVNIHLTVSPEHRQKFEEHVGNISKEFEKQYGVAYAISFSEQKAHTDTIAVGMDNEPFRNGDGSLLFRPAGHGALIENLNDIQADIIFIKNIDNVVPDSLKQDTITFKKALAGIMLEIQHKLFLYLSILDKGAQADQLTEMLEFASVQLGIDNIPKFQSDKAKTDFLWKKFDRPLRVCGMVKNEGEPGGGPFYAGNEDGTNSLQIVESSQVDSQNASQVAIANSATHFNPVDLVCAVKNYKGQKFDLTQYVDYSTGFISKKSKDGKELKAQELPGLWNGSMSDWNTIFVEVPIATFNPVKTVNDLLRPQHQ